MFIFNKYYSIYLQLCQVQNDIDTYCERHHIIPRSLGGTNKTSNITRLTPRQHYIAHRLLTKFTVGNALIKMNHALHMFCIIQPSRLNRYSPPARIIEAARLSLRYKTQEHKDKISEALKSHTRTDSHCINLANAVSISNKERDVSKWRHKLASMKDKKRPEHSALMKIKMKEVRSDTTVYTFIKANTIFRGTRNQLIESYSTDKISNSELGMLIKGRYKTHKGWALYTD